MKRIISFIITVALCLGLIGCDTEPTDHQIAATTMPVYEFTQFLCDGTNITVTRLITENISCLHDYTLQVNQMRAAENAEHIIISGGGLEDFLVDILQPAKSIIDASEGIDLICQSQEHSHESHNHTHHHDPHIWLSPANAKKMAHNIYKQLAAAYPEYETIFAKNSVVLDQKFEELINYSDSQLNTLSNRQIITFHDGFTYLADAMGLHIVCAIEEEPGAEASATKLVELIDTIKEHQINQIFVEANGSSSAAEIISAETGAKIYTLDMALSGNSYFDAMYHNIDTLKEALQ